MDSQELSEWMAYAQIEPFGEERKDLRSGIITAMIANGFQSFSKKQKKYKPQDFMPKFNAEKKTQQSLLEKVKNLNKLFGGKDLRKQVK